MHRVTLCALTLAAAACGDVVDTDSLEPTAGENPAAPQPIGPPQTQPELCRLPLDGGMCNAAFRRFGFDQGLGRCREFLWGGCAANENNFETLADCRTACGGPAEPRACGGFAGQTCSSTEFCDFPQDGCDFADGQGVCRPRPDACNDIYLPVCGCDGQTYGNACYANASGTGVAREGTCD